MAEEIFHTMRSTGRTFTKKEWHEYLDGVHYGGKEPLRALFGYFVFNEHDICLNPEKHHISVKDGEYGYFIDLEVADCGNGLWSYGVNYSVGTAGGGFGVSRADSADGDELRRGYKTKTECLQAACDRVIMWLEASGATDTKARKLREKVVEFRKELTRPKVVQLELF